MVQPVSLKASLFAPSTSLAGNEPATVFRGENVVIRDLDGIAKFECYPGSKDLSENYNIDIAPAYQVETATVEAPAGITSDGNAIVSVMLYDVGYGILVPLTAAEHTTAALIAAAVRDALEADELLNQLFIVGGSGADVSITDRHYHQNDLFRNLAIENASAAYDGCEGITNPSSSVSTLEGVAGFRLSGTVEFSTASKTVTGTGTKFLTELHTGQCVQANNGEPFFVTIVHSDTEFEAQRLPTTSATGQIVRCHPVIFEIDRKRGVLKRGNAIIQDRNDIVMVGDGELYLNGSPTGFSASRKPCRLERAIDGTYSKKFIGFLRPPALCSIEPTFDGTKGMLAGKYSFLISFWNPETRGYSNPSEPIKLDPDSNEITIVADGRFYFDFTQSINARPPNAEGFTIWGSLSGGGITATNNSFFAEGPWYRVRDVRFDELDGDFGIHIEYLDSEVNEVVSYDNNPPPDCEWVCDFANSVFYISALGKRAAQNDLGTNPGSYVVPAKASNREAAPYVNRVNIGEEITGFTLGAGRLFTQTHKGVSFVTPTGRTPPFTMRPFWTKGGVSPYGLEMTQGDVFMMSGSQPLRSPSTADIDSAIPYEIGKLMVDLMRDLPNGHYITKHDPKNQQVCFIGSAIEKNAAGYWISRIFPWDLQRSRWMPVVLLSKTDRDQIVSSAAIVDDRLEFLAGGRVTGGTWQVKTYRYDEATAGESVSYNFAFQPSDLGEEEFKKMLKWIAITGRVHNFKVQVHGTDRDGNISISDIANGTNSLSGDIYFGNSNGIQRKLKQKALVKNLHLWTIRCSGIWPGTGSPDRIDEIVCGVGPHGGRG